MKTIKNKNKESKKINEFISNLHKNNIEIVCIDFDKTLINSSSFEYNNIELVSNDKETFFLCSNPQNKKLKNFKKCYFNSFFKELIEKLQKINFPVVIVTLNHMGDKISHLLNIPVVFRNKNIIKIAKSLKNKLEIQSLFFSTNFFGKYIFVEIAKKMFGLLKNNKAILFDE